MTRSEFCSRIESMRNQMEKLNNRRNQLLYDLEDAGVDLYGDTDASQADDINQAINCYIDYGEYSPEDIWEDIVRQKYD